MSRVEIAKHHYLANGVENWPGGTQDCLHCPLPKANAVHEVEGRSPEVVEEEARRLGERPET